MQCPRVAAVKKWHHLAYDISWIQETGSYTQETPTPVSLIFSRDLEVVKVGLHVHAKCHQAISAAVRELSCWQFWRRCRRREPTWYAAVRPDVSGVDSKPGRPAEAVITRYVRRFLEVFLSSDNTDFLNWKVGTPITLHWNKTFAKITRNVWAFWTLFS